MLHKNTKYNKTQWHTTTHKKFLLYVLYTAELFSVVAQHQLRLHMYADDSQVYVTTLAKDAAAAAARLSVAIADINDWTKASRLRLNPSKTQVMWLGTKRQLDKIIIKDILLLSTVVPVVDSARNLRVNIDSQLSMDMHVAAVSRSGYYQLRQLRPLTRSLSTAAAERS